MFLAHNGNKKVMTMLASASYSSCLSRLVFVYVSVLSQILFLPLIRGYREKNHTPYSGMSGQVMAPG